MSEEPQIDIDQEIAERFKVLPKVVQDSITSSDVSKRLRTLADSYKLHVDQWQVLENLVMFTILGLHDTNELQSEIQDQVGLQPEEAAKLAAEINAVMFEPIRQELERQLSHPEAKVKAVSAEETAKNQAIASESVTSADATAPVASPSAQPETPTVAPVIPGILPATPPAPKPTEKAVRAPISSSYTSQQASTERKAIEGDPYRELP